MFIIQTKSAKNMNCVSQVSDRMILKTALQGLSNKDWFVSVDLVRVQEKGELQIVTRTLWRRMLKDSAMTYQHH